MKRHRSRLTYTKVEPEGSRRGSVLMRSLEIGDPIEAKVESRRRSRDRRTEGRIAECGVWISFREQPQLTQSSGGAVELVAIAGADAGNSAGWGAFVAVGVLPKRVFLAADRQHRFWHILR